MMAPISLVKEIGGSAVAVIPTGEPAARAIMAKAGFDLKTIEKLLEGASINRSQIDITKLTKQQRGQLLAACRKDPLTDIVAYPKITPPDAEFFFEKFLTTSDPKIRENVWEMLKRRIDETPENKKPCAEQTALLCDRLADESRGPYEEKKAAIEDTKTSRDRSMAESEADYKKKVSDAESKRKNWTWPAALGSLATVGITVKLGSVFAWFADKLDAVVALKDTEFAAGAIVVGCIAIVNGVLWGIRQHINKSIVSLKAEGLQDVATILNNKRQEVGRLQAEVEKFYKDKVMEIQLAVLEKLMDFYPEYVRYELYKNGREDAYEMDFADSKTRQAVLDFYRKVMGNGCVPDRSAAVSAELPQTAGAVPAAA